MPLDQQADQHCANLCEHRAWRLPTARLLRSLLFLALLAAAMLQSNAAARLYDGGEAAAWPASLPYAAGL